MKSLLSSNSKNETQLLFEAAFEKLESEQLMQSELQAQQHGGSNKPSSFRQYQVLELFPVREAIQKAIHYNYTIHQPMTHMLSMKEYRTNAAERIAALENENQAKERKLLVKQVGLEHLQKRIGNLFTLKIRRFVAIVFGCAEGSILYFILTAGYPLLFAASMALLLALISCFGTHISANWICKSTTKKERLKRYCIVLTTALLISISLGVWRNSIYNDTINLNTQIALGQPIHTSSSLSFVIISFTGFLVALGASIRFWINESERRKLIEYQQQNCEVSKAQNELAVIQDKIDTTKNTITSETARMLQLQECAYGNERRLLTLAQEIIKKYESTNCEFRKDGVCPQFFGEEVDFKFKLYFTTVFNTISGNK